MAIRSINVFKRSFLNVYSKLPAVVFVADSNAEITGLKWELAFIHHLTLARRQRRFFVIHHLSPQELHKSQESCSWGPKVVPRGSTDHPKHRAAQSIYR
jgi:hypothetical protein